LLEKGTTMAKITSQMIDVTNIILQGIPWFSDEATIAEDSDRAFVKQMFDRIVSNQIDKDAEVLYLSEDEFAYNTFLDWEDIYIVKIKD
jgi:hypothetical protein